MNCSVVSYLSHYDKLKPTLEGSKNLKTAEQSKQWNQCNDH